MSDNCKDQRHLESVSLKEYFERILAENKQSMADALAIRTSETDRRLEFLNGEAGRLKEMQTTYLLRKEYEIYHEQLVKDVRTLENFKLIMDTKASQSSVNWAYAIAIISIILTLIALIHEFTTK
jgi:hypothetical protein